MLQAKDLFSLPYYEYGEAYYGSLSGMRFRLAREPLKDVHFLPAQKRGEAVLRATVWPEPDAYATAPDSAKESCDFSFTEEGLLQAAAWLNACRAQR